VKKPCTNCPFRPKTFTPLDPDSVGKMLDEVLSRTSFSMYCHKDMLYKNVECVGAVRFKAEDQSGAVFKNEAALVRAHGRSRRSSEFSWRDTEDEEDC
jgi:hypothetical protein